MVAFSLPAAVGSVCWPCCWSRLVGTKSKVSMVEKEVDGHRAAKRLTYLSILQFFKVSLHKESLCKPIERYTILVVLGFVRLLTYRLVVKTWCLSCYFIIDAVDCELVRNAGK